MLDTRLQTVLGYVGKEAELALEHLVVTYERVRVRMHNVTRIDFEEIKDPQAKNF